MKSYGWLKLALILAIVLLSNSPLSAAVDNDGDEYQITLTGPGTIVSSDPANIILAGTSIYSSFTLRVIHVTGDGLVNVGNLTTNGADLGQIRIDGDLGSLLVGRVINLEVSSIGKIPASSIQDIQGNLGIFKAPNGIFNADLTVQGNVGTFQVGSINDPATFISNSTIDIQGSGTQIKLEQSLTNGSSLTVNGSITTINIAKSVAASTLQVDGSVAFLTVRGGVTNGSLVQVTNSAASLILGNIVRDSEVNVGNRLMSGMISGLINSTLKTGTLDSLLVGDDIFNSDVDVTNDLLLMQVGDINGLTLRVGGSLGRLQSFRDLADSLVSVYTAIGKINVNRDMDTTTIMAGIDIGPDMTRDPNDQMKGNCTIGQVSVTGDMIDSSVAAGIDAVGPDFQYGDGNDILIDTDLGVSRINSVRVTGDIRTTGQTGESFTISAADGVETILSRGRAFTGTTGLSVNEF